MIYFPIRDWRLTPKEAGLDYEDVSFESADGVKLSGWYIPASGSKRVALLCHGNSRNISYCVRDMSMFHGLGLNVFIFDYRGYGKSEGRPSEKGTSLDAEAAWDYLERKRGVLPRDIVICGRSLGAAIAGRLAAERNPGALVLESGFTSLTDMGRIRYPYLPVELILKYHYDLLAQVPNLRCPVLVVHSPDDQTVPYAHGLRLFRAAPKPKRFLKIHGAHNVGYYISGARYKAALKNFLVC